MFNGYQLRSKLMRHQIDALRKALRNPESFAHLLETGCGKSVVILAEYSQRLSENDIMDLLVIAPKGCVRNWYIDKSEDELCELNKHLSPELLAKLAIASNNSNAPARQALERCMTYSGPRALFVNVEALSRGSRSDPTDAEQICRQFLKRGRCMMVVDESTTLRNHKSKRTKAIMRLGEMARSRRILTGLVTPKSPLDLFSQFNFLDERILSQPSYTAFRARYAKIHWLCNQPVYMVDAALRKAAAKTGYRELPKDLSSMPYYDKVLLIFELGGYIDAKPIIKDYQNLDELQQIIRPFCAQVLKKDCLDLPPKTYEIRDVELSSEQKHVYKQIKNEAIAELENGLLVSATTVLAQLTRLHQITCGHVKDENGTIHDITNSRVSSVLDVLREHDGKAIIWVVYTHELRKLVQAISAEFGEESVAEFWGGNVKIRANEEARFLTDPECRFMVSTPQTGGRGNTWNEATLVVYASNSFDLEHRFQSEDRCHRIGQKNRVTYIDLIARRTVEEKIVHALRKKINLTTAITGETWREWVI